MRGNLAMGLKRNERPLPVKSASLISDARNPGYRNAVGLLCFLLLGIALPARSAEADPNSVPAKPKRVLVVHSFGSAAPPFTTHSLAFETELARELGLRVDLDEVSLDVARYTTLDMEEALIDFMRKRQTRWQPDLVVPVGSPAGVFLATHRERLFPAAIPILYLGMDQRRLPAGALERNAAFVGESFDLPGLVEDILHIAPATTNIAVVIGASPLERFWTDVLQREYQPFTNRVRFTWFNDLSFDQMLERSANLPPHSFLLLVLLMRDAIGVTHNADEALLQIHKVANAPINGIFQHQLGLGIVGGRLYQAELEGVEAARVAVRILKGEPASNFPARIVPRLAPRYDWRELRRWKISEDRLPPSSLVLFREPTAWQRYRGWILSGVVIFIAQALLIFALLANLVKRRRAELELLRQRQELTHVSRLSTMGELSASLAHELNQPLAAILSNTMAAQRGLSSGPPNLDELREILGDIVDSTKHAGEVIRRVRALVKKGEQQFNELAIDEVIRDVADFLQADIASRHGRVEFELTPNLPAVRGDPVQLQQVLVNLTLNAFDAMETMPASSRRAVISAKPEGHNSLRVSVRDYGMGIPPDKLETVFHSFYTTKPKGMGMGLSVTRSIVEAHGGRIWAENHSESGAVFHLTLPAAGRSPPR